MGIPLLLMKMLFFTMQLLEFGFQDQTPAMQLGDVISVYIALILYPAAATILMMTEIV